ncbi:hypothetical protein ABEY54_28935 [Priestia megaterium]
MSVDSKHLNRLITAKQLLVHAKSHLDKKNSFDISVAILHIDNVLEYLIKTVGSYQGVEYEEEKSLKNIYYKVSTELKKKRLYVTPSFSRFEGLRMMRNQIQHDKMLPFDDVELFYERTEKFFKDIIKKVFSLDYDTLDIEDFIKDPTIKSMVKSSKINWESGKTNQAIADLRNAFDNAKRIYLYELFSRNYRNLDELMVKKNIDYRLLYTFKHNIESLTLSSIGIDIIKYETYQNLVEYLPKEFHVECVHRRRMREDEEYTQEQCTFVRNFVIEAINIMQEKKVIDEVKSLHKRPRDWANILPYKLASSRTLNLNGKDFVTEGNASYISAGLVPFEMTYGFEITDQEYINHIKTLNVGDKANETDVITGIYYYVITHEPPRWRVCITIDSSERSATMLQIQKQMDR